jgi:thiol-disulfide isomerase/thioredoxin
MSPVFLGGSDERSTGMGDGQVIARETDYFSALNIIKPSQKVTAPDFSIDSLDGEQVTLSDFRGKVIFLNFWATWCGPCRMEVQDIDELHETLKDEDFAVMAIDIQEKEKRVRSYMEGEGIDFPVYLDRDGRVAVEYAVSGIPTTYIIDPDGIIVGRAIGPREWASKDSIAFMRSLMK